MFAVGATVFAAACSVSTGRTTPAQRAVAIETEACGHTSSTNGTGVVVADAMIVTAAHVVVGASAIRVAIGGEQFDAAVVALDVTTDLALLHVQRASASDIAFGALRADDSVSVFGAQSGTVQATVTRRLLMTVDDVRRQTRSERSGFELDISIEPGDSGAGVFDSEDRLVGIVFAVPTARSEATFAVDATEIKTLLTALPQQFECNANSSLIEPVTARTSGTTNEGN